MNNRPDEATETIDEFWSLAENDPVLKQALEDYKEVCMQLRNAGPDSRHHDLWLEIQAELMAELNRLAGRQHQNPKQKKE